MSYEIQNEMFKLLKAEVLKIKRKAHSISHCGPTIIQPYNDAIFESNDRIRITVDSLKNLMQINIDEIAGLKSMIKEMQDEQYAYALASALEAKAKGDFETAIDEADKAKNKYARSDAQKGNAANVLNDARECLMRRGANAPGGVAKTACSELTRRQSKI